MALFTAALICVAFGAALGGWLERRRQDEASARKAKAPAPAAPPKPEWLRSTQPQPGTAGFTIAAALNGVGCLGRSAADEPVFVLCARDKVAAVVVRDWAGLAERYGTNPKKVAEALELSARMTAWRERHGGGKVPD